MTTTSRTPKPFPFATASGATRWSHNIRTSGSDRPRSIVALMIFALLISIPVTAHGQLAELLGNPTLGAGRGSVPGLASDNAIHVSTIANLNFSCLRRSEEQTITYNSINAGQFSVSGRAGRDVRIRLLVTDVQLDGNHMTIAVRPDDVAYSRDGGITWRQFQSATLGVTTTFPAATQGNQSTILVRIGGTLKCGSGQPRGQYNGSIRLSANYE